MPHNAYNIRTIHNRLPPSVQLLQPQSEKNPDKDESKPDRPKKIEKHSKNNHREISVRIADIRVRDELQNYGSVVSSVLSITITTRNGEKKNCEAQK